MNGKTYFCPDIVWPDNFHWFKKHIFFFILKITIEKNKWEIVFSIPPWRTEDEIWWLTHIVLVAVNLNGLYDCGYQKNERKNHLNLGLMLNTVTVTLLTVDIWFMLFNSTFNNISVISWRSVLLAEEATYKLYHIMLYLTLDIKKCPFIDPP